jgi:uncharacterized membrane protein
MKALGYDHRRLRNLLLVLGVVALSLACSAMLNYRVDRTGSSRYAFMSWNLFLAWIPLIVALAVELISSAPSRPLRRLLLPLSAVWLAFLPNAPYLATDLIHLTPAPGVPFAFDQAMLAGYAVTGVLIGLVSVLVMRDVVEAHAGRLLRQAFVPGSVLLAAFGTYVGRAIRLNSWEVFSSPARVLRETALYLSNPDLTAQAVSFTLFFAAFLLLAYLCLFGVADRGSRLLFSLVNARR